MRRSPEVSSDPQAYTYLGCDQVRAASVAPVQSYERGYSERLDGYGDGIGCKPYRGRPPTFRLFDDQYRSIVSCRSFIVSSRHPEETQKLARIQVSAFRQVLASTIGAELGHDIANLDMTEHDLHVA